MRELGCIGLVELYLLLSYRSAGIWRFLQKNFFIGRGQENKEKRGTGMAIGYPLQLDAKRWRDKPSVRGEERSPSGSSSNRLCFYAQEALTWTNTVVLKVLYGIRKIYLNLYESAFAAITSNPQILAAFNSKFVGWLQLCWAQLDLASQS